jgi:hypothetical protein
MSNAIIAQLSSDTYATALGITVQSPSPVLALCRQLVASSTYGSSTPLDAYRGDMLCLRVRSIGEAAKLGINGQTRFTLAERGNRRTGSTIESESEPVGK